MKAFGVLWSSLAVAALALTGCGSKADKTAAKRPSTAPTPAESAPVRTNDESLAVSSNQNDWLECVTNFTLSNWTPRRTEPAQAHLRASAQKALIKDRLERLLAGTAADYFALTSRGGLLFLLKSAPPAEQPLLVTLRSLTNLDSEQIVLDPNKLKTNASVAIDWYVPSLDGKFVAVSLTENRSKEGALRIYATAGGEPYPDVIAHVRTSTADGSVAWNFDTSGFFYTRYPRQGEKPEAEVDFHPEIYFHRLGTSPEQDSYELGKEFPPVSSVALKSSPDGRRLLASVANRQNRDLAHYLREPSGEWRQVFRFEDQVRQVEFGRDPLYIEWGNDPGLYLLSHQDAPKGKVLRLPLEATSLTNAAILLAEGKELISSIQPAASGLGLIYSQGGPSQFAYLDYFDNVVRRAEQRPFAVVREMAVLQGDEMLFRVESYVDPYEWLSYNPSRNKERVNVTPIAGKAVSFGDIEVVRENAKSKDGSVVPLNLVRKRGTRLTNSTPTILAASTDFGISQIPNFDVSRRLWLDQGGVFAVAGLWATKDWTGRGALTNEAPIRDGLAACAEFLIRSNYTSAVRLAVRSPDSIPLRQVDPRHATGIPISQRIDQWADNYSFLCEQLGLQYSLVDRGPWSGAITPTSASVKAKLVREALTAKLLVSRSQSLLEPISLPPGISENDHGNVVQFAVSDLEPDSQYYYALEVNGRLEQTKIGAFRTLPKPGPASFTFAFSGDARTGSVNEVFDRIREHAPLFFLNLGDFHYLDIQTNSRARFREGYDAVLASPQQSELYRNVPFVYVWDDHDFTGNNSNRKAAARLAARLTYDEYVPHYPLPLVSIDRDGGPICQSFAVGRVKFIMTDLRSERDDSHKKDDAAKTMMGAAQKAWFKKELLAANGRYPLICWLGSVPWIGKAGTNYYYGVKTNQFGFIHHTQLAATAHTRTNQNVVPGAEDWWSVYTTERRELADFIKLHRIRGLCILHADSHMLAADDGTHSDYATGGWVPIPVMCAAPLDKEPSIKGGPYSQGIYRVHPGEGCYGLVTVTDRGTQIDVAFSGRNHQDEEKISLRFSVPASLSSGAD